MEKISLNNELASNTYPGRGIVVGKTADGKHAAIAYFIMGRSENSRNRVFVTDGDGIRTQAFDPSKLTDPSLIIYAPVRVLGNDTIVTNGDQTDTVYELMQDGSTFEQSLCTREFEPDEPNFTPRISAILHVEDGGLTIQCLSLKAITEILTAATDLHLTMKIRSQAREDLSIHMHDGNPLPSFEGEPKLVEIPNDMDEFGELVWNSLNEDNKVSLFIRFINIEDGTFESKIYNKNK